MGDGCRCSYDADGGVAAPPSVHQNQGFSVAGHFIMKMLAIDVNLFFQNENSFFIVAKLVHFSHVAKLINLMCNGRCGMFCQS